MKALKKNTVRFRGDRDDVPSDEIIGPTIRLLDAFEFWGRIAHLRDDLCFLIAGEWP